MITVAAAAPTFNSLRSGLLADKRESCAILLCSPVKFRHSDSWRLIVREVHIAPDAAYEMRTPTSATLRPEYGLPFERVARERKWALVYCHTHPQQTRGAAFSVVDDVAELALAKYATSRSPGVPHVAMVFSQSDAVARVLGSREPVRLVEVGKSFSFLNAEPYIKADTVFDRQVRAFGEEGQHRIQQTRIGIVGLGGTGSIVAQELAYLGGANFVLVDRDTVDSTNLNRTAGASRDDVGVPKVVVAERHIKTIQPEAKVVALKHDVLEQGVGRQLAEVDVIFSCTDSHASRHLLNQLSYQYLVPCIDLGVAIHVEQNSGPRFAGHVKALTPGEPCLWCIGNLDSRLVREETMSAAHRQADPYFGSAQGVVQPAVISINGTISSLAITMFLSMVAGIPAPARYLVYDGNRSRVSAVTASADPECYFCSHSSSALGGDAFPLPEKRGA